MMTNNFQSWGDKRKSELRGVLLASGAPNPTPEDKSSDPKIMEECTKVDERVQKFRDKITALKIPEEFRVKLNSVHEGSLVV
jgi:hypothetical protein